MLYSFIYYIYCFISCFVCFIKLTLHLSIYLSEKCIPISLRLTRDLPSPLTRDLPSPLTRDLPSPLTRDLPSPLTRDLPSPLTRNLPSPLDCGAPVQTSPAEDIPQEHPQPSQASAEELNTDHEDGDGKSDSETAMVPPLQLALPPLHSVSVYVCVCVLVCAFPSRGVTLILLVTTSDANDAELFNDEPRLSFFVKKTSPGRDSSQTSPSRVEILSN